MLTWNGKETSYMYQKKILAQHYFSHVKNISRDNKLREFYLKLLDRNVVTKRELFTYGIAENALCPRCKQNDSIIHTFCNCHWTTSFFSEVIKWFNIENATSFAPSSSELFFDLNNDRENQSSLDIVKKPYFTLLVAKYYLYINKLAPKDLSLDWEVWLWKNPSFNQLVRIHLTRIISSLTALMLLCELVKLLYYSFSLFTIILLLWYFLLVWKFCNCNMCFVNEHH